MTRSLTNSGGTRGGRQGSPQGQSSTAFCGTELHAPRCSLTEKRVCDACNSDARKGHHAPGVHAQMVITHLQPVMITVKVVKATIIMKKTVRDPFLQEETIQNTKAIERCLTFSRKDRDHRGPDGHATAGEHARSPRYEHGQRPCCW